MSRALLLDFDDTLVDTQVLAPLRRARQWRDCKAKAGETVCFDGVIDMLGQARQDGWKIAIVTTSPSNYAEHLLRHHGIAYDTLVAYHCVGSRKPHLGYVKTALDRLGCTAQGSAGLGDHINDLQCFTPYSIPAVGAGWSRVTDREAGWTWIAEHPSQVLPFLRSI